MNAVRLSHVPAYRNAPVRLTFLGRVLLLVVLPTLVMGAAVTGIFAFVGAGYAWGFTGIAMGITCALSVATAYADWYETKGYYAPKPAPVKDHGNHQSVTGCCPWRNA